MVINLANKYFGRNWEVLARRYTIPVNKFPVFRTFKIKAINKYQACRLFDQEFTAWTRLECVER